MNQLRLDDLYRMVAHIYGEQNALRSRSSTFAHFTEVCGMLTIHDRRKKREGVSVEDALCKALGWFFPLLAKAHVKSVEELVYRKYPYACPYCRKTPHDDMQCKSVRGTHATVDHEALRKTYAKNQGIRPISLNDWQKMFQNIYPRTVDEHGKSTIGLFEELGELAEAVRVFDRYPKYFAGEAADVFSYLMGIANEHAIRLAQEEDRAFSFETEFLQRYPGLCTQCGFQVCVCPSVPQATVGRMAKELEIGSAEDFLQFDAEDAIKRGKAVASAVLERIGGYPGLLQSFPFDRGEANRALMFLCIRLADLVADTKPQIAERLRSAALTAGGMVTDAGAPQRTFEDQDLALLIRATWREVNSEKTDAVSLPETPLASQIANMLGKLHVLFVCASPKGATPLRVNAELRAINEAVGRSRRSDDIQVTALPASTPDDLRRALLSAHYEIVHFAGHGSSDAFILEEESGAKLPVRYSALSDLFRRHPDVKCVIFNGCDSAANLSQAIAPYTIAMDAVVSDNSAIEFARGFYDAVAAGKDIHYAVEEGKAAAALKNLKLPPVKVLKLTPTA